MSFNQKAKSILCNSASFNGKHQNHLLFIKLKEKHFLMIIPTMLIILHYNSTNLVSIYLNSFSVFKLWAAAALIKTFIRNNPQKTTLLHRDNHKTPILKLNPIPLPNVSSGICRKNI